MGQSVSRLRVDYAACHQPGPVWYPLLPPSSPYGSAAKSMLDGYPSGLAALGEKQAKPHGGCCSIGCSSSVLCSFPYSLPKGWLFPGSCFKIPYWGTLGRSKRLSRWTPGARGGEHTFALVGLPRATTSGRPRQHTLACPEVVFSPHHPHGGRGGF